MKREEEEAEEQEQEEEEHYATKLVPRPNNQSDEYIEAIPGMYGTDAVASGHGHVSGYSHGLLLRSSEIVSMT